MIKRFGGCFKLEVQTNPPLNFTDVWNADTLGVITHSGSQNILRVFLRTRPVIVIVCCIACRSHLKNNTYRLDYKQSIKTNFVRYDAAWFLRDEIIIRLLNLIALFWPVTI